jgi:sarcosine oxidase
VRRFDCVVVGLGATGGGAVRALARRGARVLGLDRFSPPHAHGSSHGRTRLIREAYFEDPLYVPLVRRAYDLWAQLQARGPRLWRQTGALVLGDPAGAALAGARASARAHAVAHEELDAAAVRGRWPFLQVAGDQAGLFETRAGLLFAEACLQALLGDAGEAGAELRTGEAVRGWSADGRGVSVDTERTRYEADALVLAAGPWTAELVHGLPLRVERQVVHWFEAPDLGPERCPIVLWEHAPGRIFYVTPDLGDGVKAARHHEGETAAPGAVRPPGPEDEAATRALLARLLPAADGALREARTCLYTNTPDGHFVVDRHPGHARVVVASPCSGHGFKFAPAVGELVADLALGLSPALDPAPFAFSRFARG